MWVEQKKQQAENKIQPYMKAIKLLQTTAVLTVAFIAWGTLSSSAQQLFNVQFGDPTTINYSGPGPVIGSAGDYWNAMTNSSGYPISDYIWPLNDNSNNSTAVSIDISATVWVNWEDYGGFGWTPSWEDLLQTMVQFFGNYTTVTFSGLNNSSVYDIYVLNGPYSGDNAAITLNGVTNNMTGLNFDNVWVAGQNYVDFTRIPTDGSGNIVVGVDFLTDTYTRLVGMQVYAEPATVTFITQPQSVTNAPGSTAVLSCLATGGSGPLLTYQWQQMVGGTYVNMPGQTNSTLTITNLQPSDGTNYVVIATAGTSATSNPATITLLSNPSTSISLNPGITIINGTAGFHYQVQYQTALGTNWLLLQDIPSLPTNPFEVFDPTPANQGARFYKAVVLP